ncbi:MAG: hypothetical protein HY904_17675 [Deltaproteobacteria bacterium]|nr:hypothetical protein [Deltaproteobacteria bacterium]
MQRLGPSQYAVVSRDGMMEIRRLGRTGVREQRGASADLGGVDPAWLRALAQAGKPWAWALRGWDGAAAEVTAVRRAMAGFRLFDDPHGNTTPVPESVVLRARQALQGTRRGARVGVLGGRGWPGIVAARRGMRVEMTGCDGPVLARGAAQTEHPCDVVFVDPPQTAAWMGRQLVVAAARARDGGRVSLVAHPLLRDHVVAAAGPRGLVITECMQEHTAVLLPGLIPAAHRWDHWLFRRQGARAAEETPVDDAVPGAPLGDTHAHSDVILVAGPDRTADARHAVERALAACGAVPTSTREVPEVGHWHFFAAFADGGHLSTSWNLGTGRFSWDLFPFHAGLDAALAHHLLARLGAKSGTRNGGASQR